MLLAVAAGCRHKPDPQFTTPLSQWRQTGAEVRRIRPLKGPTVEVPAHWDVLCNDSTPPSDYVTCGFTLDESSGRLQSGDTDRLHWLHVQMSFEPHTYDQFRHMARPEPQQLKGGDPAQDPFPQGDVQQSLTATLNGQRYTVGCWNQPEVSGPPSYSCTLVLENRSIGYTEVEFYAPAPAPPPATPQLAPFTPEARTRLDRIIAMMSHIEASFLAHA